MRFDFNAEDALRQAPLDRLGTGRAGDQDAEESLKLGEGTIPLKAVKLIYRGGRRGTRRKINTLGERAVSKYRGIYVSK